MNVLWVVAFVCTMLAVALSLLKYSMDTATPAELRQWAYLAHWFLPRFITRMRWFQEFHYRTLWEHSNVMFWGSCFPTDKHRYVDIGIGLHCKHCGDFIESGYTPEDHRNLEVTKEQLDKALLYLM